MNYGETTAANPSPTFTWQGTDVSGPGPTIPPRTSVRVLCRKVRRHCDQ